MKIFRTHSKEYNNKVRWLQHDAMELGKNHCLPLRFPFKVLFGSEEVLHTWKYNVCLCMKVNILAKRNSLLLCTANLTCY